MHLKEGVRGYFKSQSAKGSSERFSAPEVSDFLAQYRISRLGLNIVPEGSLKAQCILLQKVIEYIRVRIAPVLRGL